MKKMLKRLLNNKGLTLTELIVALFLTSVILAVAMGMLAPVKNLMNTLKSNAHMDTISSTVDEYFRGTLQAAKTLKFIELNDNNTIKSEDTDGVKTFFSSNGNKVKALAVVNVSDDAVPEYRLYDLETIPSGGYTDLVNILGNINVGSNKPVLAKAYSVFNDAFYNDTSCAVEFYNAGGTRLQVASQCFRNGESVNQKHVLSFNLLNSNISEFTAAEGTGVFTDVDPEAQTEIAGRCYLILYTTLTEDDFKIS